MSTSPVITATVTNIQRFSIHDGPGIRSTVFFKGCPLRCVWCHNPETYRRERELIYDQSRCMHCQNCIASCKEQALLQNTGGNKILYDKQKCSLCGDCAANCPCGAMAFSGKIMTAAEILHEILQDRSLYDRTGGGVTLSGGEATMQYEAAKSLLCRLRKEQVHAALDTCGLCQTEKFLSLCSLSDIVLFDIKHTDSIRHKELTGSGNELILYNLKELSKLDTPIEIRIPYIPGYNDDWENTVKTAQLIRDTPNITGVTLLGYHKLGLSKLCEFDKKGTDLNIIPPKQEQLLKIADSIEKICQIKVTAR